MPVISPAVLQTGKTILKNKKLPHNVWQATRTYGLNITNNLTSFKDNAFIISSLVLVGYRILISAQSAEKSTGVNAAYQKQEATRTRIREIAGWTFSYIFLRAIQFGLGFVLRRQFFSKVKNPMFMQYLLRLGRAMKNTDTLKKVSKLTQNSRENVYQNSDFEFRNFEVLRRLFKDFQLKSRDFMKESITPLDEHYTAFINRLKAKALQDVIKNHPKLLDKSIKNLSDINSYSIEKLLSLTDYTDVDIQELVKGVIEPARPERLQEEIGVERCKEITGNFIRQNPRMSGLYKSHIASALRKSLEESSLTEVIKYMEELSLTDLREVFNPADYHHLLNDIQATLRSEPETVNKLNELNQAQLKKLYDYVGESDYQKMLTDFLNKNPDLSRYSGLSNAEIQKMSVTELGDVLKTQEYKKYVDVVKNYFKQNPVFAKKLAKKRKWTGGMTIEHALDRMTLEEFNQFLFKDKDLAEMAAVSKFEKSVFFKPFHPLIRFVQNKRLAGSEDLFRLIKEHATSDAELQDLIKDKKSKQVGKSWKKADIHIRKSKNKNLTDKYNDLLEDVRTGVITDFYTQYEKWLPLILGSIPAVYLSGYLLERYTREHTDTTPTETMVQGSGIGSDISQAPVGFSAQLASDNPFANMLPLATQMQNSRAHVIKAQ